MLRLLLSFFWSIDLCALLECSISGLYVKILCVEFSFARKNWAFTLNKLFILLSHIVLLFIIFYFVLICCLHRLLVSDIPDISLTSTSACETSVRKLSLSNKLYESYVWSDDMGSNASLFTLSSLFPFR